MRTAILVLAFGLALSSASVARAGAEQDMIAADKAFAALAAREGAHAAFLAYMTDDVLLYDGTTPPIVGKAAAAAYYAKLESRSPDSKVSRLAWWPVSAEASTNGSLGFTRGRWTFEGKKPDGSVVRQKGYYVTEWRRQKDGSYKFCLDIGGTD